MTVLILFIKPSSSIWIKTKLQHHHNKIIYVFVLRQAPYWSIFYFVQILWKSYFLSSSQFLLSKSIWIKWCSIFIDYDVYQYSLGSTFNLVPLPKIILFWFVVVTQHETLWHKLRAADSTRLKKKDVYIIYKMNKM